VPRTAGFYGDVDDMQENCVYDFDEPGAARLASKDLASGAQ
jgi:hypothetical protein